MPILHAEIQIDGHAAEFVAGSFSFIQVTDYKGRPSTDVRLGLIELTLVGEEAAWKVWDEWMLDSFRRISGRLVFFEKQGQVAKRVVFYDAYCVFYECKFDARGRDGQGSFQVELNLSAAAKEVDGQYSEAHSIIPWATDSATRYRALTQPTDYVPTAELAAANRPFKEVPAQAVSAVPAAAKVSASYLIVEMEPRYYGEETGSLWGSKVTYLSEEGRKQYLLTVDKNGLIRNAQNELFDTAAAEKTSADGVAIFVMDPAGNMYASLYQERGLFHHSSFLAGEPVAAAGEITATHGVVTKLSNGSGHYQPDPLLTQQFVEQLRRDGAKDTDKISVVEY